MVTAIMNREISERSIPNKTVLTQLGKTVFFPMAVFTVS